MYLLTFHSCIILIVIFTFISPMESSQRGQCKLSNLTCEKAKTCYNANNCDEYDPDAVNIDLLTAIFDSAFDGIVTKIRCKIYYSKNKLCDLTKDIKNMLRTNCSNSS